jgi:hypothetical protein
MILFLIFIASKNSKIFKIFGKMKNKRDQNQGFQDFLVTLLSERFKVSKYKNTLAFIIYYSADFGGVMLF